MWRIIAYTLLSLIFASCTSDEHAKKVLRFAHFWTEPAQQTIIDSLISQFEYSHRDIVIEQIPLQWYDGRMKLLLAHSSSQKPDITHIGIEWAQEYISSNIFASIKVDTSSIPKEFLQTVLGNNGEVYCMPWTMNTRALVLTHELAQYKDVKTWEQLLQTHVPGAIFGINATEKHSVMKKVLPILWSKGSIICTKLPISETCDDSLIYGLELLTQLKNRGLIEQSRILDQYLIQGTIRATLTGQWILPQLQRIPHTIVPRIPGISGASILSGDCLGISNHTQYPQEAIAFTRYLTSYTQTKQMCLSISDAGFPAHVNAFTDIDLVLDKDRKAYLEQCRISKILPSPSYFLDAEEIIEDCIMQYLYGTLDAKGCLETMKSRLYSLEQAQKKGS